VKEIDVQLTLSRGPRSEHFRQVTVIAAQPSPSRRPPRRNGPARAREYDVVDEWGMQSFPASDPPANW